MAYSEKVLDHYNEPRNVGSLDKKDPNVGTGLVGAPECFGGGTLISVPDKKHITMEEAFEEGRVFPVWSFNIKEKKFEIKNARAICSGRKLMHSIKINNSVIWVTPEHEFYTIENGYVKNSEIDPSISIRSFIGQNHRMEIIGETKEDLCYTLQVEENNNYVVITDIGLNNESGIVVRNCGDVMKLDIKVGEDNRIDDPKFKTFGCLASETKILTSRGWRFIRSFEVGEKIFAFNGEGIVENEIIEIVETRVHIEDTLMVETDRLSPYIATSIICSKDHIFWRESNRPIEAISLEAGDRLMSIEEYLPNLKVTENEVKKVSEIPTIKDLEYYFEDFKPAGPLREGNFLIMFDLHLKEGANVYIAEGIFVHNCGSAIASSSLATEWIKGKTVDEAMSIDNTMIVDELSLPPVKIHCSVLAESAIKAAIADYRKKQSSPE